MCEPRGFGHHRKSGGCCCEEMMPPHFSHRHHFHFVQGFPTKKEQVEILKDYKQKLQEEIAEIDKRLKELE